MSYELYIFGSIVRGDVGPNSDVDILVLAYGEVDASQFPVDWSFYTKETVRRFYEDGRLFAWHLHLESVCIFSNNPNPLLKEWGMPNEYVAAKEDIKNLNKLLTTTLEELRIGTPSLVYELGLVYVCLRDIAMSASWHLMNEPCFSSNAPFIVTDNFPLSLKQFKVIQTARHMTTRGIKYNDISPEFIQEILDARLTEWADKIERMIE